MAENDVGETVQTLKQATFRSKSRSGGHAGGSALNASSFGTKPFGGTWMK
jgi:hypothetical protein